MRVFFDRIDLFYQLQLREIINLFANVEVKIESFIQTHDFLFFVLGSISQKLFASSIIIIQRKIMQVVDWISKQAGKIADNFNSYKFYVKHTPERIDSSAILALSVYASRQQEAVVPCHFRWSRIKNGLVTEVDEFRGNTFICEPSDVGCTIQVEVTSTDPQYAGTALLKYGPVELDILLRETIENSISVGEAKFSVDLYHNEISKQCIFTITDDYIHIAHCNSSAQYKFYYCLGEPLINTFPKDPTKISIVFSQKFQNETLKFLMDLFKDVSISKEDNARNELTLNIKFLNRKNKDELLFIMKGFNAKKQLKNTTIINKIEKLQIDDSNLNYVLQIQSLKADLLRLFNLTKRQQEEKHTYYQQTCKLQQQIEDIISSYTKLIEGKFKNREQFEESFAEFQQKKDQAIAHKYQRIEEENYRLKQFIRENMDKDFKDVEINYNKLEPLQRNSSNPFLRKKEPFAQIGKQENYEQILNNLSGEEEMLLEDQANSVKQNHQRQILVQKLNQSLQKIDKLQTEIEKYQKNSKSVVIDSNEVNQSMSKHNMSALEISTSKVIEEKLTIEKKYAMLKEEYRKLKAAYHEKERAKHPQELLKEIRQDQLLLSNKNQNPQFNNEANKEINRLKELISQIEKEKENLRLKSEFLTLELKKEKEEHERTKLKLQKKMIQLNEQIAYTRKSNDALNRSQHLSMEMDDYNCKQNEILKEQVGFLQSQNVRLSKMCEKYKGEYKRLKEIAKLNSPI